MHQSGNTLRQAAIKLLKEFGPMHYRKLTEKILSKDPAASSSKKPEYVLNRILSTDITRNGSKSEFIRRRPGVYGLRALHATGPESEDKVLGISPNHSREGKNGISDHSRKVRIPFFPVYGEVRHLLKIWPGRIKANVTGLHRAMERLRGTPQNPVDWRTDPDTWIPEKLSDDIDIHDLAMAIWVESNQDVNPRHTYGHWLLVNQYRLLRADSDGKLQLTDQGRDFIKHQGGRTEIFLDQQEGLVELLTMISDSGPVRLGGLVDVWAEYLKRYSNFRTDSTIRDTLRRRLKNLLDRGLIDHERTNYSITDEGIEYLEHASSEPNERQQIRKLAKTCETKAREDLLKNLLKMDPKVFENLVGHLLEKMNYQNVKVVGKPGDGGVDVTAEIELGITSVREVVQAKRHRNTVPRKDLDALRGSLYRFNAVQGTIVTTSRFTKGAKKAAFAEGVAPITLIDRGKLVDLLIEHGIGIRKRAIEVLSFDPDGLSQIENSAEE